MSLAITLDIPDDIAENYTSDDELKRSMLESVVLNEFQKGLLSIGQSAELLGLTYEGFIDLLGQHRLPFITATSAELEESYRDFKCFMKSYQKPIGSSVQRVKTDDFTSGKLLCFHREPIGRG